MGDVSADRVSAQRERQAWMAEAIVMMSRLCEEADTAEAQRDEAQAEAARLRFRTSCHPEANGRKAVPGERQWDFRFTLEDGRELHILAGADAHRDFRSFILREELDDAADVAQEPPHD